MVAVRHIGYLSGWAVAVGIGAVELRLLCFRRKLRGAGVIQQLKLLVRFVHPNKAR